jgi:hypothetical protein
VAGHRIIVISWASVACYAAVAVPNLFIAALDNVVIGVAVGMFLISLPIWIYAYGLAVTRTARGDDIAVSSLFFLNQSAPKAVQRQLLGSVGASIVVAAVTAVANPFGILVPMLPLGLTGLWGARHGVYPRRPERTKKTGGRR